MKATRIARNLVVLLSTLSLVSYSAATAKDKDEHWVGTWATAPTKDVSTAQAAPRPDLAGSTLRQIVHVSLGGKRIRVKFSNAFGAAALKFASAHLASSAGGSAIKAGTDRTLTFGGQPSATIPAGALIVSDPIDFDLLPLSDLVVSVQVDSVPGDLTVHSASHATSYVEKGDSVAKADLSSAAPIQHWYFLSGIDVEAENSSAAVVTLGDSITDGTNSTANKNERWPDTLARRLQANKKTSHVGVLNLGIGGNRILHDGSGQNALARLDRDVLAQTGVRYLVVLEGINDIGNSQYAESRHEEAVHAEDLIRAFEQIVARAHAHNILVYGATILPFEGAKYFSPAGEADRQAVNKWMRTGGKLDGVIDLDAATRDPQSNSRLVKAADSGDHLHPADDGYRMMGEAVDLKLFSR